MSDILSLADWAVKSARDRGASQAEAYVTRGTEINVHLENNAIKIARSQTQDGIGVRVFVDRGLGFASVNQLEEESASGAVDRALALAAAAPADEANRLPGPGGLPEVEGLYHDAARDFAISDALRLSREMIQEAREYDSRVQVESGIFVANVSERAIQNSEGVRAHEKGSLFEYFVIGSAEQNGEVSAFQFEFGADRDPADIDVRSVAREFARKSVDSLGAGKGESFVGSVILSPGAVLQLLLRVLLASLSSDNVQKGMSRLEGKVGQAVASPMFTMEDDATLKGGVDSSTFDREGVPRARLPLIREGVLQSYLYNTYCARKENRTSTGHASGGTRTVPGIASTNVLISPGEPTLEELVEDTKKGVLVTRFSGPPNPFSGEFSGVVKGGFLIEDGKRTRPLLGTLIAGNVFDLLSDVSGLSKETRRVMSLVSPYIRTENVSITSG
jgi:PmbA protein